MDNELPIQSLSDIWNKVEELDSELAPYVFDGVLGQALKHPLLYDIFYSSQRNAEFNARFKMKKEMLEKALNAKKYSQYLVLHELPYRLDAFKEIIEKYDIPRKNIASLLHWCWIDSENIWQNLKQWKSLLKKYKKEL